MVLHLAQNIGKRLQRQLGAEKMQHLDKPAHMRPLAFMGQINKHINRGHGMLMPTAPIQDGYRMAQVFNADLIYGNIAVIALILDIFYFITVSHINAKIRHSRIFGST